MVVADIDIELHRFHPEGGRRVVLEINGLRLWFAHRVILRCTRRPPCSRTVHGREQSRAKSGVGLWHRPCAMAVGFFTRRNGRMRLEQAQVVRSTWNSVLPVGDTFAELFYGRLFALDPALRKLFPNDMVEQGRNLTAMLSVAAANVGKPERIAVALRQLGQRHRAYGVKPE